MIEKNKVMIKLDINTPDEIRNELNEIINNAFDYEKKVFKDIEENNLYVFSGDEKCIAKGVKKLRQNKTFEIYGRCKVRGEENTAYENKAREAYIKFTQGYFWETTLEKYVKATDVDTEKKARKYLRRQNPVKVIRLANKNFCYKKSAFILCCKAQKTKETLCEFTHREDNREDKSDKSIEE